MTTRVVKEGNVTTTVVDMTNGVGGRSAEVRKMQKKNAKVQSVHVYHYCMSPFMCISDNLLDTSRHVLQNWQLRGPLQRNILIYFKGTKRKRRMSQNSSQSLLLLFLRLGALNAPKGAKKKE